MSKRKPEDKLICINVTNLEGSSESDSSMDSGKSSDGCVECGANIKERIQTLQRTRSGSANRNKRNSNHSCNIKGPRFQPTIDCMNESDGWRQGGQSGGGCQTGGGQNQMYGQGGGCGVQPQQGGCGNDDQQRGMSCGMPQCGGQQQRQCPNQGGNCPVNMQQQMGPTHMHSMPPQMQQPPPMMQQQQPQMMQQQQQQQPPPMMQQQQPPPMVQQQPPPNMMPQQNMMGSGMPPGQRAPQSAPTCGSMTPASIPAPDTTEENLNHLRRYLLNVSSCKAGLEKLEATIERKESHIAISGNFQIRTNEDRYNEDIEGIRKALVAETEKCIAGCKFSDTAQEGPGQCFQMTRMVSPQVAADLKRRGGQNCWMKKN